MGHGNRRTDKLRNRLIEMYGLVCHLCGKAIPTDVKRQNPWAFSRDHVEPISAGGPTGIANQRPSHVICNSIRKSNPLPWTPPGGWPVMPADYRRLTMRREGK